MKKQLFIALSFAVLTGISYQACGMEKEDERKNSFVTSQTDILLVDSSEQETVKTPVIIPKTYDITLIVHPKTDQKICTILDDIAETQTSATVAIDPKTNGLLITTENKTVDSHEKETVKGLPLWNCEDKVKNEILDRFTGLENTITKTNAMIYDLNKLDVSLKNINDYFDKKEKSKRSYLSRTYNFTQFLGYTFLASFGTWTVYNMIKKSNSIQDATATLFKSKDGLLGLGATIIGLPNMYTYFAKTFWPKTPISDKFDKMIIDSNSPEYQKMLTLPLPPSPSRRKIQLI